MRCNRSKISIMLWQQSKHTDASKLWCFERVATLWLEMSPNVPRAAAWSAHSQPRFPLGPYTCCMVSRSLRWAKIMDRWHAGVSCTCVRAWIVHKQTPAARWEPQQTHQRSSWARSQEDQGKTMLQSRSHLASVVGMSSGTRESEMSLCGDDGTKHDIISSMRGSWNHTPSSKSFTINNASTTICKNSPLTIIIASFTCYGTSSGKIRITGFQLW